MGTTGKRAISAVAFAAAAFALTSCTDETVIYRERPIYEEPVEAALDFVGYSDPSEGDKLTVCGNCHVGQQSEWEETAHAFAWEGLQGSGHAQAFCEGCHTVNSLGNTVEETEPGTAIGGYAAATEERYHDVQCESCHGPGLPHVQNPDAAGNQPQASILVGTDLSFGCGECHSGAHHPFVEEWEESPHGNMNSYPAGRQEDAGNCYACHSGEGALKAWGVKANYLEKEELLGSSSEFAHITCAVCHDPHSNENEGQLRYPIYTQGSIENHLCAQCHDRRTAPDASSHGLEPHSPEADLLVGLAGWFPPGANIGAGEILGSHGSEANEGMCAGCHVVAYSAFDEAAQQEFFSVGHGFRAAPCVDATTGLPTGEEDCALSTTARSFQGCVDGGCHASEDVAASVLRSALISVRDRAVTLENLLEAVDPNGDGAGGEIDGSNPVFTVAEGAFFNLHLAHHGSAWEPGMTGDAALLPFAPSVTHNPFLIETLLIASIDEVRRTYPTQTAGVDVSNPEPVLTRPAGL